MISIFTLICVIVTCDTHKKRIFIDLYTNLSTVRGKNFFVNNGGNVIEDRSHIELYVD